LGSTHLQPAQPTTVGKRATLWMQDLVLDLVDIDMRIATVPCRGVKGTTGTQASFLEIFGGDHKKVRELERIVVEKIGFKTAIPVSGQTYTRKLDAQVLGVVAGIAASASKFSGDLRVLQAFGEIEEPFEKEQIGSSAMAYKRNPMRSERIASLARFVMLMEPNANLTHSLQYFERTLDDSANRRVVIPESFLATEAILILMGNIATRLEVHPARIRRRLMDELPFMATEELIVRAVQAGGDRQDVHERIRQHSIAAAHAVKHDGKENDLLERLAADSSFKMSIKDMQATLDPARFIGRAPQQVEEFLTEVVEPLLSSTKDSGRRREEVWV
jgi:adenylosuccinate lyase